METKFKVTPVDFQERNTCLICASHRRFHLATTDHAFVPGDSWAAEISARELQPGDTIASVTVPEQRSRNDAEPMFWIYRRR